MKKSIQILFALFCVTSLYAQTSMTDSQVMDFVVKEHKKGTSQQQIVTKLMQNGVDISQIRRVRTMYERMQNGSGLGNTNTEATSTDRSRKNNSQYDTNKTGKDIADETRQYYADERAMADKYTNYRTKRQRTKGESTYDEYDEDYLELQEEMDDWLPGDTATMYKQLVKKLKKEKKRKKVFGRDIFNNEDLSFEPNMNIATPRNYVLGPGDAVYVDIYGASQRSFETTVSPDGYVNLEGFGPIQVSGLTVEQANARVKKQLGARYSSSSIKLTVGQTRTMLVNVMGEVKNPGTYTLSAFATVFHALYMAGGINDLGTLRNIKVYRSGRLISVVDIYDYILSGKMTGNVKLTDGDVIVVGAYDCLVNITGKVKRPMYYEMKKNESLGTLIKYSGGFAGDAYTKSVRVLRKNGRQYSIYNVNEFDMSSFLMADDDSVSVDSVIPRFENMVEVKGAVFRPGMYQLGDDINSVRTLIEAAEGATEFAFTPHAVMHRMKADRHLEVISVDLQGILTGKVADIPLQNEDVLFVPTKQDVQEEQTIEIHGEVQYPGVYKYAENETLEDFILQAGGLKDAASTIKVDVARRRTNPEATNIDAILADTYSFSLKDGFVIDGEQAFALQPFDQVYVRQSPGFKKQQNVSISGEVLFGGTYTITKENYRLSDLLRAAGGANEYAYVKGARLIRKTNEIERIRMEEVAKIAEEQQQKNVMQMAITSNSSVLGQVAQKNEMTNRDKFRVAETYQVGIYLDRALANPGCDDDIILREGDQVYVPKYNGTVKINGAVMHANTVGYIEGKKVKYYIDQAGGFSRDARKRDTYILYMNGTGSRISSSTKVMPGSEIFVPERPQSKMTVAERIAMGSGITSIATMIATLANVIKNY